jgi:glycosyltransferase involved in cell wall biosynthesis
MLTMHSLRNRVFRALAKPPPYLVEGPLVSVIIPSYEEQKYLPNLLASINNQTYCPIEIIVADQSPSDAHAQICGICQEYGARCLYITTLGPSYARNGGAREAKGEIFLFSDADNILAHECVENLVSALLNGYMLAHPVQCVYDDFGLFGMAAVWTTNWLKPNERVDRIAAVWREVFNVVQYDESCDPMEACREDLRFGWGVADAFGHESLKMVRDALIGTSARRQRVQGLLPRGGFTWQERSVRKALAI